MRFSERGIAVFTSEGESRLQRRKKKRKKSIVDVFWKIRREEISKDFSRRLRRLRVVLRNEATRKQRNFEELEIF